MKKIKIFILIAASLVVFMGLSAFTLVKNFEVSGDELNSVVEKTKNETVFDGGDDQIQTEVHWFYVRVRPNVRTKSYMLVGTASRVESGEKTKFERALWWGMTRGQLAVGPFWNYKEAVNARLLYRKNRERIPKVKNNRRKKEVHWFLVTFKVRQRSNAYKLQRMPARLASGITDKFLDALYEGMTFERLTVGPFGDYNEAEEAKAMYRENE